MFDDLYDAISFLGSWRWPEVMGEITAVDVERIKQSVGSVRLRLAVAYKFSLDGDHGVNMNTVPYPNVPPICVVPYRFPAASRMSPPDGKLPSGAKPKL